MSETHYIANPATTLTDIHSLHPYHHYEFSIAVYTVAKGPLESRRVWMPQAGMNTTICIITKFLSTFLLFHQCLQVVRKLSTVKC